MKKSLIFSLLMFMGGIPAQAKMYHGTEDGKSYVINVDTMINGSWGTNSIFLSKGTTYLQGNLEGTGFYVSFNSNSVVGSLPCGTLSLIFSSSYISGNVCGDSISQFGLDKNQINDFIADIVEGEITVHFPRVMRRVVFRFIEPILKR